MQKFVSREEPLKVSKLPLTFHLLLLSRSLQSVTNKYILEKPNDLNTNKKIFAKVRYYTEVLSYNFSEIYCHIYKTSFVRQLRGRKDHALGCRFIVLRRTMGVKPEVNDDNLL